MFGYKCPSVAVKSQFVRSGAAAKARVNTTAIARRMAEPNKQANRGPAMCNHSARSVRQELR